MSPIRVAMPMCLRLLFRARLCRARYLCPKRPDHRKQGIFSPFTTSFRAGELLSAFIAQVYLADDKAANIPPELIVSESLPDSLQLQSALSFVADKKIRLGDRVRGHRAKWLETGSH